MKSEYILLIKGNEWDIKGLGDAIDQLGDYKNNYKNKLKYFSGMRKNWFGLLILPRIFDEDDIKIVDFVRLVDDKKVHKVYIQALGKMTRKGKQEWAIKLTAYNCDMHEVHKYIRKILKMYNIECDEVFI